MKLFTGLFSKAPPPPPTLAERIASLQTSPTEEVVNAALGSDDVGLRVGAIRLLPDGDALWLLAGLKDPPHGSGSETPSAVRHAAFERLAQLIDEGAIDLAALCRGPDRWLERITVASLCKNSDFLRQVLARTDDPTVLATLAVDGPTSRVRQSAASAMDDPEQLHEVFQRVRGKDKSVYRIIKQKCDALTAARRQAEESARAAIELCESLEQHGAKSLDPHYSATLNALTARWRALPPHSDPLVEQRVSQAVERCREVIAEHEQDVARQAALRAAEREAREARERALEAEQRAAAEQAEADARALAAATAAREAEARALSEQRAAEAQAYSEIGSLIRLSSDALQRGNTRKAARFRQGIEEAMKVAPSMPPYLVRNLQQLDDRLNELKQWKDYVVAPKRIELIEEMEALAGSQEDPEALAEHVRALQQEWRTMNKGIAGDASADGERFQQAYQAAFKPCQEYFASQAAVRRENLEARKKVLERLKSFEASQDVEHGDRRLLAQVLREAPREWRSHSPVDPDASRPAEIEFQQSMDRLRKILNSWYERNEAEKKSLIAQARQLSAAEDTSQAIEGVKRLQVLWKETGPVSQDQSQALWDEFRTLCDAVYKQREQAHALHAAGLETEKARALALCDEVEQANREPAAERQLASTQIREWRAAFDGLGEVPRADAQAVRDRFLQAISRYESGLAERDLRDAEAAESNLLEAARHVRAYERAVMTKAPAVECETLRSAAEGFVAGVRRWPVGGLQVLKLALSRAEAASNTDDAARESALRMLCIRWEIHTATPSPPEDEELRQECQMRMLMEGLGQGRRMDDSDWDSMLAEWIGIGAISPEIHEGLERRLMRCLAKRPVKGPRESAFQGHDRGNARTVRDPGDRKGRRDGRGRPDTAGRR